MRADPITDELVAIARDLYRMFREAHPAFMELFDEDIEWHVPDTFQGGGDLKGIAAVIEFFAGVAEVFEVADPEPEEFLAAGDKLVVLGIWHGRARKAGVGVDVPFAHVWQVRDGRFVYFRNYIDAAKVLQALP